MSFRLKCRNTYKPFQKKDFDSKSRRSRVFPAARDFPPGFIPLWVKTGGILPYFEDLNRGTNKEFGPKDFFEIASKYSDRYQDDRIRVNKFESTHKINLMLAAIGPIR